MSGDGGAATNQRYPLGSRLLGSGEEGTRRLRIRTQVLLTLLVVGANVVGALVAVAMVSVVIPGPSVFTRDLVLVRAIAVPVYVVTALAVGTVYGTLRVLRSLRWAIDGDEPTVADQRRTLAVPWRLTLIQAALWGGAAVVLGTLYGLADANVLPKVLFTIVFSGVVVCANAYVLTEFALRPVAARALAAGVPKLRRSARIGWRTVTLWVIGSGIPVLGLMVVAVFAIVRSDVSKNGLAVAVLGLGGVTLVFGLLLTVLTVSSLVAPVRSVRHALASVERGDLDTEVVVFDGTELGELQSGFNRMVTGLADREKLRDLFGRHVGEDVAAAAMARSPELGGEERDVAVFFVDLVGSTKLASEREPQEVVTLLNRFFGVVVDEVESHGGLVNKFEGDGALAVFGAPADCDDPPGAALAAARSICRRMAEEIPECSVGMGVASGRAVAGNIGDERRFEYTVIGDPVNEAARLAELSKTVPGGVLAAVTAVDAAGQQERDCWTAGDEVTLRGRGVPTQLAVPVGSEDLPVPAPDRDPADA
ncbi:adenylate/guanylate cyclase domain-containing protein [Rhodococcus aerolatus]